MKYFLAIIFFIFVSKITIAQSPAEQKAKLLYEIPKYITWEWDEEIMTMDIGAIGNNTEILKAFESYAKKGYPNGTAINIIKFSSIESISQTHILLVGKDIKDEMKEIQGITDIYNTLIFTDNTVLKKYSMINFSTNQLNDIYFEINTDNIENVSIQINSKIYNLGGIEIDKRELIEETESELKNEQKKVEQQRDELKEQQSLLKDQMKKIDKQTKYIEEQTEHIETQTSRIKDQKLYLEQQKANLLQLQDTALVREQELIKKTEFLEEQTKSINEQQKRITGQKLEVRKQKRFLEDLNAEAEKQERKITEFKSDMARQNLIIEGQKNLISIFIGFLTIIVFLIILIYRAYKKTKRVNKELGEKNAQIREQKNEIERQNMYTETINKQLEKLSIIARESRNAISIYDTKGDIEWVNIGFTRLYGYTLQLWIHDKDINIVNADINSNIAKVFSECVESKEARIYETAIHTRNNKKMWVQRTISPITNNKHEITKLVMVDSNITEIKEAEIEITKQHKQITKQANELKTTNKELEKLSFVASKTDNSVIIFNHDGIIEWVNDGFERMLGVNLDDFIAEYGNNLLKSSLNENINTKVNEAVSLKKSVSYSTKTKTKKGTTIWIQTTLTPIFDDNNVLDKFVAIDSDITKIKLAEQEILKQKQAITDSIVYARRIQSALLPPSSVINEYLPKHFIMFKPKDIVSGDFYYSKKVDDKIVMVAADSTGHGVPGAFMSMLGIAFFNEILATGVPPSNVILDKLRNKIKTSLRQSMKSGSPQDGMDLALVIINTRKKIIEFSGANNPLIKISDNQLEQYKGDWMPVGIYLREKPFTRQVLSYKEGDRIFMFSDGIIDQMGGPKGRKFMFKQLKTLLLKTASKTLDEQHVCINKAFEDWKKDTKQLDDVVLLGIEF